MTDMMDRRWYELNKHTFPASVWREFDPHKDHSNMVRRDMGGNTFFFLVKPAPSQWSTLAAPWLGMGESTIRMVS